jgi:HAD superfamily hydrolase (TIGR01509 family)
MIKGVIFDVDGTLLDTMWIWDGIASRYIESFGKKPEDDIGDKLYSLSYGEAMKYIKDTYNIERSLEQVAADVKEMVRKFYEKESMPKKGVVELIKKLNDRGIPMAAATSNEKDYIIKAFERLGILRYFRKVVNCGEYNTTKSSPEIYMHASEDFNLPVENIAVFEDAFYAVKTAKDAGYITIGVAEPTAKKEEQEIRKYADAFINDFDEFNLDDF